MQSIKNEWNYVKFFKSRFYKTDPEEGKVD